MRPVKALALLGCAALLAAAAAVVVPETLPNLWAGVKQRPESPALVAACWIAATAASITGKFALAGGALTWRGTAAVHIAGTVSNRIVPAGVGAGGAYLIALRKGGHALPAASAMVILWASASGVVHGSGVLIGGLWLHSGIGVLVVVAVLAVVIWRIRARAPRPATERSGWRAAAGDSEQDMVLTVVSSPHGEGGVRTSPRPARVRQRVTAVRNCVGDAAAIIGNEPRHALNAVVAQAAAMICLAIGFAIAVGSFGVPITMTKAMAAYVAGTALSATFPTPAGIGTADAALVGALVIVGASLSEAVPVVLVFRSVILFAPVAVAAVMAVAWMTRVGVRRRR